MHLTQRLCNEVPHLPCAPLTKPLSPLNGFLQQPHQWSLCLPFTPKSCSKSCNDAPGTRSRSQSRHQHMILCPRGFADSHPSILPIHSTLATPASTVLGTAHARPYLRAFALAVSSTWDILLPGGRVISLPVSCRSASQPPTCEALPGQPCKIALPASQSLPNFSPDTCRHLACCYLACLSNVCLVPGGHALLQYQVSLLSLPAVLRA